MDLQETELWKRWTAKGDVSARESLIRLHAPWARLVARDVYIRTRHRDADWGDYVQNATVGLIEAADRFDPARGIEFRTFARHRVRGAVFNGLRQLANSSHVSMTVTERSGSLGEDGEDAFLSFVSWTVGLGLGHLLDVAAEPEPAHEGRDPYAMAERSQASELIRSAVDILPERERTVLIMHYFQHVPFVDIARYLMLTKGRVSQLHRQAIERLRRNMREAQDNFVC